MEQDPYWGPMDAMHQFCEDKYAVSPFIAEFWNATSNIPSYIIPGMYGLYHTRKLGQDFRVKCLWASTVLVGCGSFMFHSTMLFKWELWDEIPMTILILCGIISKDDTSWVTTGVRQHLVHLISVSIAAIGMYLYINKGDYDMFLHTFTILVLIDLVLAILCSREPDKHGSWAARSCFYAFTVTLSVAKLLWEIEVRACPKGSGGALAWLHVVWHVLSGMSIYYGILGDAQCRYAALSIGTAVDDPENGWPFLWVLSPWLRHASTNGASKRE